MMMMMKNIEKVHMVDENIKISFTVYWFWFVCLSDFFVVSIQFIERTL